jgi:hypothetical protein
MAGQLAWRMTKNTNKKQNAHVENAKAQLDLDIPPEASPSPLKMNGATPVPLPIGSRRKIVLCVLSGSYDQSTQSTRSNSRKS